MVKFWLDPLELAAAGGFPQHELREIARLVSEHRVVWIGKWNEYFGD